VNCKILIQPSLNNLHIKIFPNSALYLEDLLNVVRFSTGINNTKSNPKQTGLTYIYKIFFMDAIKLVHFSFTFFMPRIDRFYRLHKGC
jgi:hypothetical protein